MSDHKTIEAPPPAHEAAHPAAHEPTAAELERLADAYEALVRRRRAGEPAWPEVEAELREHGWTVSARLLWVVEARRGQDFEQGLGHSRDEAYAQLRELVRLDEGPRVP